MPGVLVSERGTKKSTNDCGACDSGPASKRHFGGVEVDPLSAADPGRCQHFPVGRGPASTAPDHSDRERKIVVAGAEGLHGGREDGEHVARCSQSLLQRVIVFVCFQEVHARLGDQWYPRRKHDMVLACFGHVQCPFLSQKNRHFFTSKNACLEIVCLHSLWV